MDGNITTRLTARGGASSSGAACESAREDEQACEAGGTPKRRIEESAPDVNLQYTLGGDGKRVTSFDKSSASGAIVGYSGGQLRCSDEGQETQSLLFSSMPRAAASGNVLDPSGSGENVQQLRPFEIDPAKHKIFLSHSGEQKNFVEQLCVDLEARGYLFPFFDQRHHSLPKGKDFVPLIKQAAGLCHVAVIVLSEEFLCSKWPMIELAEFHAAKQGGNRRMSMLPLFYKLQVGDLDDESIKDRWMPVWNELARRDERIDVSEWAAAVRALRGVNGLSFGRHNFEVAFRKEIIGSIWQILPADLLYDSAREMVGYDRICETLSQKFVDCNLVGASMLGLYGTSGVGKTTVAKALCDYFAREFVGRVCHIELGAMTRIKHQEWILKTLCGIEDDVLKRLQDDRKGLKLMRDCMKWEPVLLVIDNLTNDEKSRREAHEYLTIEFHPRSKVIITARSKEVLQDLIPGVEFCMSIPKLNLEEAEMIFLKSAAPMRCFSLVTDEERRVLRLCVEMCLLESDDFEYQFEDGDIDDSGSNENLDDSLLTVVPRDGAYHPLALSALGNYFYRLGANVEVLLWKDSLEKDHELMRDVLQSPSITSIIHLQFNTFSWSEQLLFLDLASYLHYFSPRMNLFETSDSLVEWLGIFYGETKSVIERRLRDLKRSGMINWTNNFGFGFVVHSLYREFAEWYMTKHGVTGLKNAWSLFEPCSTSPGYYQGRKCVFDLVRLRVFNIPRASIWILTSKRMQELQNLVLLQIYDCTNLQVLSLAGLDSLRHLELARLPKLVTVTLIESSGTEGDGGIFESLLYVMLEDLDSLMHLPDLRSCRSLRILDFFNCQKVTNFEALECSHVEYIRLARLSVHQLGRLPNFKALHCLTELYIFIDENVNLMDAMDVVSLSTWKRRWRGQTVAVRDGVDLNESSDDSDAYHLEEEEGEDGEITMVIYMRREMQFVKEGLSIIQNLLSYVNEHKQCRPQGDPSESILTWCFNEGDKEQLCLKGKYYKNMLTIEWRFRNAEEYND